MIELAVFLFMCYLLLNVLVYLTYRSTPLLLLQLMIYFYFLHGYFMALAFLDGRESTHSYILGYPYYVANNEEFWQSFVYYCIFGLIYLGTVYLAGGRTADGVPSTSKQPPLQLSASMLLVCAVVATTIFIYVNFDLIRTAVTTGQSMYIDWKTNPSIWNALFQQSFRLSVMATGLIIIGWLARSGDDNAVHVIFPASPYLLGIALACLCCGQFVIALALGDKTLIASSVLFAICLVPHRVMLRPGLLAICVAFPIAINTIGHLRYGDTVPIPEVIQNSALELLEHGESTTTFSLYLMMCSDLPLIHGQSFVIAVQNLVPSFIIPDRVPSSYVLYAESVGIVGIQGWGMSYPSDWYLNFGFPGVCAGGVALAGFHSFFLRWSRRNASAARCIFASVVGVSMQAMRDGISLNAYLYAVGVGALLCYVCRVRAPADPAATLFVGWRRTD